MTKKNILIKAPALSMTGYGEQSRFLLKSLKREKNIELYLNNIPWGASNNISEHSDESSWIKGLIAKTARVLREDHDFKFDASIQCTIPNEWENLAPINIGYTAGIECDRVSPVWLERANKMDKVITISKHSATVFKGTEYEIATEEDDSIIDELKLNTPIEYVNYGVRNTVKDRTFKLDLNTDFNLLTVAQFGPRKNILLLIESFLEAFQEDSTAGLVIKGFIKNNSVKDREASRDLLSAILSDYPERKCKVYLLHGEISSNSMSSLYSSRKIDGYITTTHGEGFGLPIFEAACNGLPILAPNWSGQRDFLNFSNHSEPLFLEIPHSLDVVSPDSVWPGVIEKDSQWCHVKKESVVNSILDFRKNLKKNKKRANILKKEVLEKFKEEDKLSELSTKILKSLKEAKENK